MRSELGGLLTAPIAPGGVGDAGEERQQVRSIFILIEAAFTIDS